MSELCVAACNRQGFLEIVEEAAGRQQNAELCFTHGRKYAVANGDCGSVERPGSVVMIYRAGSLDAAGALAIR